MKCLQESYQLSVLTNFTIEEWVDLPDIIAEDAKKAFDIGNQQYQEFVKTRFVLGSEDVINSPITKNNLKLLADAKSISDESPQIKLTPTILTKLRDAWIKQV